MILLSEDSPNMVVSQLLNMLHAVTFVGGNSCLLRPSVCNKFTDVIAFVDVVPDNMQTYKVYSRLLDVYSTVNCAFLYPVPCVEYYVLGMLELFGVTLSYKYDFMYKVYAAYKQGTGFTHVHPIDGVSGSCITFEKLCKFLLDNAEIPYHNISTLSNKFLSGWGSFYALDSPDIRRVNKSKGLWYQFPLPDFGVRSNVELSYSELYVHHHKYVKNYGNWLNNYQTVPFDSILTDTDKYQLEAALTKEVL